MGNNTRHTCVICKKKRYEFKMDNVFGSSWACRSPWNDCYCHSDIYVIRSIFADMKKLTLLRSFISSPAIVRSGVTNSRDSFFSPSSPPLPRRGGGMGTTEQTEKLNAERSTRSSRASLSAPCVLINKRSC